MPHPPWSWFRRAAGIAGALLLLTPPACSSHAGEGIDYSAGTSLLIYQSVYSLDRSIAVEGSASGGIAGPWKWRAGFRCGTSPARPEIFGGLLIRHELGSWCPSIGLEIGLSSRAQFDEGKQLLREARRAMEGRISPWYAAVQAAPLSFTLSPRWRISVLELHVGTHLSDVGRTLRAQAGIITLGWNL